VVEHLPSMGEASPAQNKQKTYPELDPAAQWRAGLSPRVLAPLSLPIGKPKVGRARLSGHPPPSRRGWREGERPRGCGTNG
jgi:hypothetical protein